MPPANIPPVLGVRTLAVATTLTLATSSQGLFTTASKTDGKYAYNFSTVPLLAELAKLLVAITTILGWRCPPNFNCEGGDTLIRIRKLNHADSCAKDCTPFDSPPPLQGKEKWHDCSLSPAKRMPPRCSWMVSSILLYRQFKRDPHGTNITVDWKTTRTYPIPSLIYLVHNNVQFLTLKYVDPSTYQILGNLKIVTTGILFRLFLKRKLSKLQWWALVLLMVGATVSQISGCGDRTFAAPVEGYALGLVSASLSALAGVYTEFIMKQNDDCLYWQNVQLYSFGVLFNALALTLDDVNHGFANGFWPHTMFNGYTLIVWCVVLNLAFTGLLVSWIMKFADTIVKVYSTSMAMLVTMLISAWLFNMQPNLQLMLGIITASASLNLYYMNPRQLEKATSVELEIPEEKATKNADD